MAVWEDKFIRVNPYSRPAKKLQAVRKLVLHWTANFGATAMNHFNYFNNLNDRYASAHIFVDKTQALCIIPLDEIAYHANDVQQRNADGSPWRGVPELLPNANYLAIGVEMCVEKDGTFHPDTIARTEDVFVELCKRYKLDPLKDIVRHWDITHKHCPEPWVQDGQKFIEFKQRVNAKLNGAVEKPAPTPAPAPAPAPSKPSAPSTPSLPVLKNGDKGEAVKELQTLLNTHGYKLTVDGDFGAMTEGAVRDFQAKNGLAVDGVVGSQTWAKLKAPVAKPKYTLPTETLKLGDKGEAVKQLQTALNAAGFSCGAVDGDFGEKTLAAVKAFQQANNLTVDGIYGNQTRSVLSAKLN